MKPAIDPNLLMGAIAAGVAGIAASIRVFLYLASKAPADPWSAEVDRAVRARGAVPVCTQCLCPQAPPFWSCPECGFPTGDYMASMPFLQIYVIGEFFRQGVCGPPESGFGSKAFLVAASLPKYSVFAPLYWYWMLRKAAGRPICKRGSADFWAGKVRDDEAR